MSSFTSTVNFKQSWQRNNKTGTLTETPPLASGTPGQWSAQFSIPCTKRLRCSFLHSSFLTFFLWPNAGFLCRPLKWSVFPLHPSHWSGGRVSSLCSLFPLPDLSPSFSNIPDFNLSSPAYIPHSFSAVLCRALSSTNPRVIPHSWVTWILVYFPSLYQHSCHNLSDFKYTHSQSFKIPEFLVPWPSSCQGFLLKLLTLVVPSKLYSYQ